MADSEERNHAKIVTGFFERVKNRRLYIQTHDVPDPDAAASAEAFRIIAKSFGLYGRIIANGFPNRRENKTLLKECHINIRPLDDVKIRNPNRYAWVYVDCRPGGGNVTLHQTAPGDLFLSIDHHIAKSLQAKMEKHGTFIMETSAGATSTIMGQVLFELGIPFPPRLAAALSYAIITDTMDFSRGSTKADLDLFTRLAPKTNQKIISRLRNVSKPRDYFRIMHNSIENTMIYRHLAWVYIGKVKTGEIVAEMADYILSCERITWSMAIGMSGDRMYLSLRSSAPKAHCETVIHRIASGHNGAVGGHDHYAGGYILLDEIDRADPEIAAKRLSDRFMRSILRIPRIEEVPSGSPLISM